MSAVDIIERGGDLLVSSETIADGSGVQHKNVLELINANRADFEDFGHLAFETRPGYNNAPVRLAMLNEQQATLLMTFQRNTAQVREFKKALVRAFFDMARRLTAPPVPQSLPDALRAYALEVEQREALEAKVAEDAPKVAYVDEFVSPDDVVLFKVAAQQLGLTEPQFRERLLDAGWVYRKTIGTRWSTSQQRQVTEYEWRAYAAHADKFSLRPQHNAPRHHNGQVKQTLYIHAAALPAFKLRFGQVEVAS